MDYIKTLTDFYNSQLHTLDDIAVYVANGKISTIDYQTITGQAYTPTLAQTQQNKTAQAYQLYEQALAKGFSSSANGTLTNYAYADKDQKKFHKVLSAMGAGVIPTYPYDVYDDKGNTISLDQTQLKQLFVDIFNFEQGLENKLHSYVTQIEACQTVADINNIVISY